MTDSFTDKAMYNQHKEWEAEQKRQAYEDASAAAEAEMQAQEYQEAVEIMTLIDLEAGDWNFHEGKKGAIIRLTSGGAKKLLAETYPGSDVKVLAVRAKNQPNFKVSIIIPTKNADENDALVTFNGKQAHFVKVVEE